MLVEPYEIGLKWDWRVGGHAHWGDYDYLIRARAESERCALLVAELDSRANRTIILDPDRFPRAGAQEPVVVATVDGQLGHPGRVAVDMTGLPGRVFLSLVALLSNRGFKVVDLFYVEADSYARDEHSNFIPAGRQVSGIAGFDGVHVPNSGTNDGIIVGIGYDHNAISAVLRSRRDARHRYQVHCFPPIQADMYQHAMYRTYQVAGDLPLALDDASLSSFAPAYDPFYTAHVVVTSALRHLTLHPNSNLYLSPLATKPQILGFGLAQRALAAQGHIAISVIMPDELPWFDNQAVGVSRVRRYSVPLVAW